MKTALRNTLIFSLLLAAMIAQAAPRTTSVAAKPASKSKLSKDIRFSGSQVDGKYLSAGESIAEVEGDKEMGALVGVRKNFRDRLKSETARLQAAQSGKGN
jgi:hypothetical protein